MPDFLTLKEASKHTGYHQDYLGQLIRTGKIQARRVGKSWLVSRQSLASYLSQNGKFPVNKDLFPAPVKNSVASSLQRLRRSTMVAVTIASLIFASAAFSGGIPNWQKIIDLLPAGLRFADFTRQINYQGKMRSASTNQAVADDDYSVVFRFYTTLTGGSAIWTEPQTVTTKNGLFSVPLGSVTSLENINLNQPLYLSVQVGADAEMSPRKLLGAVPAAIVAEQLNGHYIDEFVLNNSTTTIATSSAQTVLVVNQTGTGNVFDARESGVSRLLVDASGNVGIGSSTPSNKLEVSGSGYFSGNLTGANLTATGTLTASGKTTLVNASTTNLSVSGKSFLSGYVGIGLSNPSTALSVNGTASATDLQIGNNADIAGTLTLGNALAIAEGGTGATSFTTNGILFGSSTLKSTSAGTGGQILQAKSNGEPNFVSVSGDVTLSVGGNITIDNGVVSLSKMANLSYGEIIGRSILSAGTPEALSTSTYKTMLALNTNDLTEGTKLFWTDTRFDTRLAATTSLPRLSTLAGLATIGSSTGQTTILGKTTLSHATTTSLAITGLTNTVLAVNAAGAVVATTTSTGAATWGLITGTLSAQTDLQTALNQKVDISTTSMATLTTLNGLTSFGPAAGTTTANGGLVVGANDFVVDRVTNNVGIGTNKPNGKLEIQNGSLALYQSGIIEYKDVVHFASSTSNVTGTMKIAMPKTWSNTFVRVVVRGYDYSASGAWEVVASGYNYTTSLAWVNTSAEIKGAAPFESVRLAHDGTVNVLLLGDTTTVWQYPNITVDVMAGFSNYTGWGTGWSVSMITSESTITKINTPAIDTYVTVTGNFGIGTTSPSNRLEVSGNGYFSGDLTAGDIQATGTLSILGKTTLYNASTSYLTSSMASATDFFASNITTSNLTVNTHSILAYASATDLSVSGQTNLSGSLSGTSATFSSTLGVTGKTTLVNASTTNLSVSGLTFLTGNVGIGTNGPGGKLVVQGTDLTSFTSSSTPLGAITAQGSTFVSGHVIAFDFKPSNYSNAFARIGMLETNSGSYLQFGTSHTYANGITNTAMTINPFGLVGIGTTSPSNELEVSGDGYFSGNLTAANITATGTWSVLGKTTLYNASTSYLTVSSMTSTTDLFASNITTTNLTVNNHSILAASSTNLTVSSLTYLMGAVGVGTTSPDGLMEVYKNQNTGSAFYVTNTNSGASAYSEINVRNGEATTGADGLRLLTMGTGWTTAGAYVQDSAVVAAGANLAGGLSLMSQGAAGNIRFYTGGYTDAYEQMRITAAGSVGIGSTTPAQMLSVAGNILSGTSISDAVLAGAVSGYSGIWLGSMAYSPSLTNYSLLSSGDGDTTINSVTGKNIYFRVNNTNHMVISSTGGVSIGTAFYSIDAGAGNLIVSGKVGVGDSSPTQTLDMKAGGTYGYNGAILAQASTTLSNYFFGSAGNLTATGTNNSAFGASALISDTSGYQNTAGGNFSLTANTEGYRNTGYGYTSLTSNTTGLNNSALGAFALFSNTVGTGNVAQGLAALYNTTGSLYSTAVGFEAGRRKADNSALATSSYSVYLGANTKALSENDTNSIVIGYNANGLGSNTVVLGNDSIVTTALKGDVGIGLTNPSTALSVNGIASSTGLQVNGNGTITGSLSLGVDLALTSGGTGRSSFTTYGVVFGSSTTALESTAAGTPGQFLVAGLAGVPDFVSMNGDGNLASDGSLTLVASSLPTVTSIGTSTSQVTIQGRTVLTNASTTNLSVSGQTYLTGLLTAVNATLSGTLGVTGKTTMTIASSTAISVSGQTYLTGLLTAVNATLSGTLGVTGKTTMTIASSTAISVSGQTYLTGLLTGVNATLSGTLGVTGKTTMTNASTTNVSVSSQLYVTGKTTLGVASTTAISVSGQTYLTGLLTGVNAIFSGNSTTTGVAFATTRQGGAIDVAEWIKYEGDQKPEPGEVVIASGNQKVTLTDQPYDSRAIGIVSTKPHLTMGSEYEGEDAIKLALSGRVPVKTSTENGEIKAGDLLTTASLKGYAMKATAKTVGVVAIALEDLSQDQATGTVLALISLNNEPNNQDKVSSSTNPSVLSDYIANGEVGLHDIWTIDQTSRQIKSFASLDLNNYDLNNVRSIRSATGNWSLSEEGKLIVSEIETNKLTAEEGLTTKDKITGEYYCMYIADGVVTSEKGRCEDQVISSAEEVNNSSSDSPVDIVTPADSGIPTTIESTTTEQTTTPIITNEEAESVTGTSDSDVNPVDDSAPTAPVETTEPTSDSSNSNSTESSETAPTGI